MRALTIHEPYASLIINRLKRFETRGRKTNVRGPLAIHAALKPMNEEGIKLAKKYGITPQYGMVLGVVDLTESWEILNNNMFRKKTTNGAYEDFFCFLNLREKSLGYFGEGRHAWDVKVVERFETPIPAKGQQGFWKWDERKGTK